MTPRSRDRMRLASAVATPLLLLLTLWCWGLSSAPGSSPDDNFHLASIWCGVGEREDLCETTAADDARLVPQPIVGATCYAFDSTLDASCWEPTADGLAEAEWLNTVGLYPPVFYATFAVMASDNVEASVVLIRFGNAAVITALWTAVFFALPRGLRPVFFLSVAATVVPMGLFFLPSTNPTSWAIASAAVVWIALLGAYGTRGPRQLALSGLAILAALMGAGARGDAGVFAVIGAGAALLLALRRGLWARQYVIPLSATALVAVAGAALFLLAGQTDALVEGLPTQNPPLTTTEAVENLLAIPALWYGALGGGWGLGWLDTILPPVVGVIGWGIFAALVVVGLRPMNRRRGAVLALAMGAAYLIPWVLLVQSRSLVGENVQPRYILPLLIIVAGLAALRTDAAAPWIGGRGVVTIGALAVSASISLHYNLRRYTTGTSSRALDPGDGAEWWWSVAPSPLVVWVIGSLAFAAALFVPWLQATRGAKSKGVRNELVTGVV